MGGGGLGQKGCHVFLAAPLVFKMALKFDFRFSFHVVRNKICFISEPFWKYAEVKISEIRTLKHKVIKGFYSSIFMLLIFFFYSCFMNLEIQYIMQAHSLK